MAILSKESEEKGEKWDRPLFNALSFPHVKKCLFPSKSRTMKKSGFTLIEIAVSMVILSISVAGMLTAVLMGRKSMNVPDHRIVALNFAQQTIEDLKGEVGETFWPAGTPGKRYLEVGGHPPKPSPSLAVGGELFNLGGARSYKVDNIAGTDLKQVTVTVSWTEPD